MSVNFVDAKTIGSCNCVSHSIFGRVFCCEDSGSLMDRYASQSRKATKAKSNRYKGTTICPFVILV